MNIPEKIIAGITNDGELYFLEIDPMTPTHDYFAMSGFTVKPVLVEDAKRQCRESLEDDKYLWKEAVAHDSTELGYSEWVDYVLDTDGDLAGFDNSLFDETVQVDGEDYIFESGSCGQHEEETLKHYFIDKTLFNKLMRVWKKYHMKKIDIANTSIVGSGETIRYMIDSIPAQNFEALAMQAITLIEQDNA